MSPSRSSGVDNVDSTVEMGRPLRLYPTGLKAGAVLGSRFQIEAAIGQGGSGQVFRAWDRVLGEPVALKILRPDRAQEKGWIKRLAREVKVARAIRHPNVCRVFDLGNVDEHWFVSMELASGGTLRDTLRSNQERPLSDRLADARAVCAGLAAIHTVGIIHRDVTPQNLLRMDDGRLVLSDFGLAVQGGVTTVHGGTPSYMAPETAMGHGSNQRSDVWQLGTVLHEIVFGLRPIWDSGSRGLILRTPMLSAASSLYRELAKLCRACLATNPAGRPGSAIEVSARLAALEVASLWSTLDRFLRPGAVLLKGGARIAGALVSTVLERPFARRRSRVASRRMTAEDRKLLRSMAAKLKAQGQFDDAHSLDRLAGPEHPP